MRRQSEIEQLMRLRVKEHSRMTWLKFADRHYSWEETLSLAQRAANGLVRAGIGPGQRVGIMAENKPEFLWLYFGILMIGGSFVPINRWQRGPALTHMIVDSGVVALAVDAGLEEVATELRAASPALKLVFSFGDQKLPGIDATFGELIDSPDREPMIDVAEPSGAVGIMYTSGTTGVPKGIVADRYEPYQLGPLNALSGVRPGETIYTANPLFHASGLLVCGMASIRLDASFALARSFSASRFWEDICNAEAVYTSIFSSMFPILLKQEPNGYEAANPLRRAFSIGCPRTSWLEFERRFGVHLLECYAMSDTVGMTINVDRRVGSVGKAVGGAEFRVVDEDDRSLPTGKVGEIVYRHPTGRLNYYNNLPEATEEAYRGGWFHSGDLGWFDEDGYMYFQGRKKEAIRRRGENISAWEISAVIDQHPAVKESAAYGVPSELGEEEVMVSIVPQDGVGAPDPELILDFCKGQLAYYAIPRFIRFVDSLPKTSTQKIQTTILKEQGVLPGTWDRERSNYQLGPR